MSEASVESVFSRHKIVHSRLGTRARLSSQCLNNQSFLGNNFAPILKIASEPGNIDLEKEISSLNSLEFDSDSSATGLDNDNDENQKI